MASWHSSPRPNRHAFSHRLGPSGKHERGGDHVADVVVLNGPFAMDTGRVPMGHGRRWNGTGEHDMRTEIRCQHSGVDVEALSQVVVKFSVVFDFSKSSNSGARRCKSPPTES